MTEPGKTVSLGILGCGNIGGAVADAVLSGRINARVDWIVDKGPSDRLRGIMERTSPAPHYSPDPDALVESSVEAVFEAAHPSVVREYAVPIVRSGKDLILMSVGGLIEGETLTALHEAARDSGRCVMIAAGAVSGLSALRAARISGALDSAIIRTTKSPASLAGAPFFVEHPMALNHRDEKLLVFSGSVAEGIGGFPKNANVAAAVALAGLGPAETQMQIYVDPGVSRTEHAVEASGSFGELSLRMKSSPCPENPRTSYLAVLGAISAVDQYVAGIFLGI